MWVPVLIDGSEAQDALRRALESRGFEPSEEAIKSLASFLLAEAVLPDLDWDTAAEAWIDDWAGA